MRKISIVQRRLETGLDLTQAELRALQREASFEPDQAEEASTTTATAFSSPLSFLPPTRPEETPPEKPWQHEAESDNQPGDNGAGPVFQEVSPEQQAALPSQITNEEEAGEAAREVIPTPDWDDELMQGSSENESEAAHSASGEELRSAVNEIFANGDFSFDVDPVSEVSVTEEPVPQDVPPATDVDGWQSGREVLFPEQESQKRSSNGSTCNTEEARPVASKAPTSQPVAAEETLVLFLLQVPGGGLGATFSAAEDADSPFAGQLKLYSKDLDPGALPGEASEFDVNLPPEGLVRLSTGRVGNNGHEWALISLDEEARSYATFDLNAGRNLKATAAVFSKSPSSHASVPLQTTLSEDKGMVIANPTDGPVVVRLSLFDEQGNQVSSALTHELDPLPSGKQVAVFGKGIFRDFPGITSFRGRMVAEVLGEGTIWTAGLSQNDGVLSFLPVSELEKSSHPEG